jgi:hypothetical protein
MISTGQANATTACSILCVMPPGPCLVSISNISATTVYVGASGTAVTTGNGYPIPSGQITSFAGYQGGTGAQIGMVQAGTASATVGFFVSSASGGTGI